MLFQDKKGQTSMTVAGLLFFATLMILSTLMINVQGSRSDTAAEVFAAIRLLMFFAFIGVAAFAVLRHGVKGTLMDRMVAHSSA